MILARRSSWITRLSGDAASDRLQLLCFAYAGGNANLFARWGDALPSGVGVHAVQLPARGCRITEPALDRLAPMVAAITQAVGALDDKPLVLFGHSMGALLAFETARALRRLGRRQPQRLLLSACGAPQLVRNRPGIHHLPDDEFVAKLSQFGGTPVEVLRSGDLMRLMLPMVRADFAAVETYRHDPEPPLACPMAAFSGLSDPLVGCGSVAAWAAQTTGPFKLHLVKGAHFFVQRRDELLPWWLLNLGSSPRWHPRCELALD